MLHDIFTIEIIGKMQGGLNNFEHNCKLKTMKLYLKTSKTLSVVCKSDFTLRLHMHFYI